MKNLLKAVLLILLIGGVGLFLFYSDGKNNGGSQNINTSSMGGLPASYEMTSLQEIIVKSFNESDVETLAKYFVKDLTLNILEVEDFYTIDEAKKVLANFFNNHPPKKFEPNHGGSNTTGKLKYLIGNLQTKRNENFRVYIATNNEMIESIEISAAEQTKKSAR